MLWANLHSLALIPLAQAPVWCSLGFLTSWGSQCCKINKIWCQAEYNAEFLLSDVRLPGHLTSTQNLLFSNVQSALIFQAKILNYENKYIHYQLTA